MHLQPIASEPGALTTLAQEQDCQFGACLEVRGGSGKYCRACVASLRELLQAKRVIYIRQNSQHRRDWKRAAPKVRALSARGGGGFGG